MAGPGMSEARDREVEGERDSLGFTVWDYENTLGFNSGLHGYTGKCPTTQRHGIYKLNLTACNKSFQERLLSSWLSPLLAMSPLFRTSL